MGSATEGKRFQAHICLVAKEGDGFWFHRQAFRLDRQLLDFSLQKRNDTDRGKVPSALFPSAFHCGSVERVSSCHELDVDGQVRKVKEFSPFPPQWFHVLVSFNHLLVTANSSFNFLIYFSACHGGGSAGGGDGRSRRGHLAHLWHLALGACGWEGEH